MRTLQDSGQTDTGERNGNLNIMKSDELAVRVHERTKPRAIHGGCRMRSIAGGQIKNPKPYTRNLRYPYLRVGNGDG